MVLRPASLSELSATLAAANAKGDAIASFDLATLNRLLEHKPEDMTATAEAGMTLAELQKHLALRGQWLPIDPPHAEQLTVGALLAADASGPRRFGYGTIRDYVIGIKVVLADGSCITCGGKVVKNVAGYDLAKLFIGSRGSLGVIVEATFKLRPLPETERFVQARCESLVQAGRLLEAVLDSELEPIVVDLHSVAGDVCSSVFVLGFAGTNQDVAWQLERAAALGANQPATLDYEADFWNGTAAGRHPHPATSSENAKTSVSGAAVQKISVLPSKVIEVLQGIAAPYLARAGNGIVYFRGEARPKPGAFPSELCQRLKQAWDPKEILPPLPR
jgi:FAD/FMN-containing dehydrogenase